LNAPALAEESRTANENRTIFHVSGVIPGVIARPASALNMIAKPILSLHTDTNSLITPGIIYEYLGLAKWPDFSEVFPVYKIVKYKGCKKDSDQD
jgi:hypothetical protein